MDIVPCMECGYPCSPGEPFRLGHDHDGVEVWMQRWTCVKGHLYMLEVRTNP